MEPTDAKHLCVIPARGGSKGLPRKNVLPVAGTPMIAYSIQAAFESEVFGEEVYVVSDDDEIVEVARQYGAATPFREPDEMAGDKVSSTTPVIWTYEKLTERGKNYDYVWNLQPTSPLRTPSDISQAAHKLVKSPERDFLASVTEIDPHYFHWALKPSEQGSDTVEMWFPDFLVERPNLPTVYRPNGAIKVGRPEPLIEHGHVLESTLTMYEMPDHRSVHVRTENDRRLVEFYLEEYADEFTWVPQAG